MSKKRNYTNRLTVEYKHLGTLSERELIDAVIDDIRMLEEDYGIKFYSNASLIVWGSDEYGDPRKFIRNCGERMQRLDSTHYRPDLPQVSRTPQIGAIMHHGGDEWEIEDITRASSRNKLFGWH